MLLITCTSNTLVLRGIRFDEQDDLLSSWNHTAGEQGRWAGLGSTLQQLGLELFLAMYSETNSRSDPDEVNTVVLGGVIHQVSLKMIFEGTRVIVQRRGHLPCMRLTQAGSLASIKSPSDS